MNLSSILSTILLIVIVNVALFWFLNQPKGPDACTTEAKICSDGSAVGRNSKNNCQFDPCPEVQYCDVNTRCAAGQECYKFENTDKAICFAGDPCIRCESGTCLILESYPMQVRCDNGGPTTEPTLEERYSSLVDSCDIAKMDFEACMQSSPVYGEYKTLCEGQGGTFGYVGLARAESCRIPTSDGGKECASDSDCEGNCMANLTEGQQAALGRGESVDNVRGYCSQYPDVVGCVSFVENGRATPEICID